MHFGCRLGCAGTCRTPSSPPTMCQTQRRPSPASPPSSTFQCLTSIYPSLHFCNVLHMYLQGVVTDCYYSGNGHQVSSCPPRKVAPQPKRPPLSLIMLFLYFITTQPYYPDGCDPSAAACDASKAMLLPIAGNNMIIGNVRIRQLRVKAVAVGTSGCHIPDMVPPAFSRRISNGFVIAHAFGFPDKK